MYLLLLIILIHEIGHLLAINLFKYDISSIIIYPFGGLTLYSSNINDNIYKEIVICIMGPLIQLIFFILIYLLKNYVYENTYLNFTKINILLFKFNLLPILPLDGGKLLHLIFDIFLPYKYSIILSNILSLLVEFVMIIYSIYTKDLLFLIMVVLLLNNLIKEIHISKYKYNKFILERSLNNYTYKKGNNVDRITLLKRNKHHMIYRNNILYDENIYLKKYVFNL